MHAILVSAIALSPNESYFVIIVEPLMHTFGGTMYYNKVGFIEGSTVQCLPTLLKYFQCFMVYLRMQYS
jgi:hypothetical protein